MTEITQKPIVESTGDTDAGNHDTPRPYTFDRVVRIVLGVLFVIAVFWLLKTLKSVLLPFLVAWLVAYILEPFVQYNKRLTGVNGRLLPIILTLLEVGVVICAIAIFVVPSIMNEAHQVAQFMERYTSEGVQVPFIPAEFHQFLLEHVDFEKIASELTSEDIAGIADVIGNVVAGGMNVVMWIVDLFLTLLYVIFIMLDYERLLKGMRRLVPPKYRKVVFTIGTDVKESMNRYFRGQTLVAFTVGILFCIGFVIVGLPLAVVMGLFIGLLNMVPYLQLISLVPTTILCIVTSVDSGVNFWVLWGSCMAVYIVVQCIQDLYLTPKIMGKAMGLNPAIILLSLSIWGTLLGIIGLIIALPLTTLLLAYYYRYINAHEESATVKAVKPKPKRRRRVKNAE